jgi:hypothetical protein
MPLQDSFHARWTLFIIGTQIKRITGAAEKMPALNLRIRLPLSLRLLLRHSQDGRRALKDVQIIPLGQKFARDPCTGRTNQCLTLFVAPVDTVDQECSVDHPLVSPLLSQTLYDLFHFLNIVRPEINRDVFPTELLIDSESVAGCIVIEAESLLYILCCLGHIFHVVVEKLATDC